MKKKNLLLALLSSSLILASCGDDKTDDKGSTETGTSQADDSNVTSGDPIGTSEPEISVDTRTNEQKVNELFALMAQGKSSTFEYEGYRTEYYGDDKGTWTTVPANDEGYTDYGTAVIPNYGIYNVEYDEDSDEMYLSSIITPNTALKIGDIAYTTKDLGTAAASVVWSESSRTHTFSTADSTFCGVMMYILGLNDYVGSYSGMKASFVVNEAGTAITNLSLALTNPTVSTLKAVTIEGMKISKVDETMNLDFEVLVSNPTITAKTAWSQYELAYFTTYIHAQFNLPFPTGASYAINESVTNSGRFMFVDYGCGNLVNSYKTILETAGFTLNEGETDLTKGIYCYEKLIAAASSTSYATKEYIMFTWNNDSTQALYYPNGAFMILAYIDYEVPAVISELVTLLSSHTFSDGTPYWPDIFYGNVTEVSIRDYTEEFQEEYPEYTEEFAGLISLFYATEAEAIAAVSSIGTQLTQNGYSYDTTHDVYYVSNFDYYTYNFEEVDVTIAVAYDDNGNYLGYITISIDSYSGSYY